MEDSRTTAPRAVPYSSPAPNGTPRAAPTSDRQGHALGRRRAGEEAAQFFAAKGRLREPPDLRLRLRQEHLDTRDRPSTSLGDIAQPARHVRLVDHVERKRARLAAPPRRQLLHPMFCNQD